LSGRITPERVIAALADLSIVVSGHRHRLPWFEAAIYVCGPGALCEELKEGLVARGANATNILFERFGATVAPGALAAAAITFGASGISADWTIERNLSLLELAEAQGIAIPNSCRSGTCFTCRSRIVSGESTADLGDGTFLPCIARPKSAEITVDL